MKIEKLPNDILTQIEFQFGESYKDVVEILKTELSENDFLNSNRIVRCLIFLAENSVDKLKENHCCPIKVNKKEAIKMASQLKS
jgi:hypothetical protein